MCPHINRNEDTASRVAESVTSRDNRWLKQFRTALAGDSSRTSARAPAEDVIGVEGARLVETALRSGVEVVAVLVSDTGARRLNSLAALIPDSARILATSDRLFSHVSGTESPQGIAALVRPHATKFDDLLRGLPLVLVMTGIQDPGNVGTLVRTAEAFGATGAAACHWNEIGTANPHSPKAMRASAGSTLRLPVLRGVAAPVLLAQLRIAGVCAYAACPDDYTAHETPGAPAQNKFAPWEVNWRVPAALLVGNEGTGLPPELVRSADAIVRIPQVGERDAVMPVDSLNAAIAGAVLLYEAARQRGFARAW
jgi:TrmH family RNA methyltransferase